MRIGEAVEFEVNIEVGPVKVPIVQQSDIENLFDLCLFEPRIFVV